jgi:hypothetical protein
MQYTKSLNYGHEKLKDGNFMPMYTLALPKNHLKFWLPHLVAQDNVAALKLYTVGEIFEISDCEMLKVSYILLFQRGNLNVINMFGPDNFRDVNLFIHAAKHDQTEIFEYFGKHFILHKLRSVHKLFDSICITGNMSMLRFFTKDEIVTYSSEEGFGEAMMSLEMMKYFGRRKSVSLLSKTRLLTIALNNGHPMYYLGDEIYTKIPKKELDDYMEQHCINILKIIASFESKKKVVEYDYISAMKMMIMSWVSKKEVVEYNHIEAMKLLHSWGTY